MDYQSQQIFVGAIKDIIKETKSQHNEAMAKMQEQHEAKLTELKKQSEDAETKHREIMDNANKQLSKTKCALIVSLSAFIVSLVFGIASLYVSTRIDDQSIQNIERVIKENRMEIPEIINTNIINDTIKVDVVNPPPKEIKK